MKIGDFVIYQPTPPPMFCISQEGVIVDFEQRDGKDGANVRWPGLNTPTWVALDQLLVVWEAAVTGS